jgi:hypothetical protein
VSVEVISKALSDVHKENAEDGHGNFFEISHSLKKIVPSNQSICDEKW